MDIGKIFREALNVFRRNAVEVVLGYLVMVTISILSLGILAPSMTAGFNMLLLRSIRKQKVLITDVFSGLGSFWSLWGACFTMGLIALALAITIIGMIPLLIFYVWWMYAFLFITDKKKRAWEAMGSSAHLVQGHNIWAHMLLMLLVLIIGPLGFKIFMLGELFTVPLTMAAVAVAYNDLAGKKRSK